jgi:phospholipid/cholesterol/gamma-HCH transport system ATP-binding protein
MSDLVVEARGVCTQFGSKSVHRDLDLDVRRGEVLGLVGGSGSGKSVLLKHIVGLTRPQAGTIKVLGVDIGDEQKVEAQHLRSRWGVLFQSSALFSSLTVAENIGTAVKASLDLSVAELQKLVAVRLEQVGLTAETAIKLPAELSGGMKKRAGLARALALDPELLFLDEPTAGLDPIAAAQFDQLIGTLRRQHKLTVVMVTHDLDSLYAICDRVAMLIDGRIISGTLAELSQNTHPWIVAYLQGPRGRAAADVYRKK